MESQETDRASYDTVLLQPPWGSKFTDKQWDRLNNLPYGRPAKSSGDFAWLQLALSALREGGRAVVFLPQSTLFRGHNEGNIRTALLQAGVVEAVVSLPPGIASSSSIATCIWVLRQSSEVRNARSVLLIDASPLVVERSSRKQLPEDNVRHLAGALHQWRAGRTDVGLPGHIAAAVAVQDVLDTGALLPQHHLAPAPAELSQRPQPPVRLLTELRLSNFKSFGEEQRVPLAPITLIYGPNSAGKSSILQSLLLLKQSIDADSLVTQGELTDAGSFLGALHRHEPNRVLSFGLTYGASDSWDMPDGVPDPAMLRAADFRFRADGSGLPHLASLDLTFGPWTLPLRAIDASTGEMREQLTLGLEAAGETFLGVAEGTLLYPFDSRHVQEDDDAAQQRRLRGRQQNGKRALRLLREAGLDRLVVSRNGLLPASAATLEDLGVRLRGSGERELGIVSSYVKRTVQLAAGMSAELRALLGQLAYLGPLRSAPQRFYYRAAVVSGVGTSGSHIALHLFDNSSEVAQVNQWLAALGVPYGLKVVPVVASGSTSLVGDLVAIILTDLRSGVDVSPTDVGFGVSQVLPIVVELLAKQNSVICIEQPEIHLHPALQAKLGDLLIDATTEEGRANQVVVETHSEHLILRLQRRVREGLIDADQISVVYVDQTADGTAWVKHLGMDERGDFTDEWPQGFFEERIDELFGVDT